MLWKIKVVFLRMIDYFLSLPHRIIRFFKWLFWINPLHGKHKFIRWLTGLFLLTIDLTPIPFLLESITDMIKAKTRGLNEQQQTIAKGIFGTRFPLYLIGLDPDSVFAKRKKNIAFVSFHTINFLNEITDAVFIHELVHIWQYRKFGSVYISEAIWAQQWGGGYNYGGEDALQAASHGLSAFNFEQQADIIEDYFRLKNDMNMQWMVHSDIALSLLEKLVAEVRK